MPTAMWVIDSDTVHSFRVFGGPLPLLSPGRGGRLARACMRLVGTEKSYPLSRRMCFCSIVDFRVYEEEYFS